LADQVFFGAQTPDISMARCPDGIGTFQFATPSFATANDNGCVTPATSTALSSAEPFLFPNPVSDRLTIGRPDTPPTLVRIRSLTGLPVFQDTLPGGSTIDVSGFPPGLYLLYAGILPPQRLVIVR
jgi:hypothetical protein